MKNILLLIHDDAGQEARLQVALDLTRRLEGHLTCLDVAVPPPALVDDAATAIVGVTLFADEISREADNRSRVQQRLIHEDISWDWADTVGRIAISLRRASRFADVIVVSRQLTDTSSPDMRAIAGDVIVKSGKPILVVPEDICGFDPGSAVIAWNGSASALAALRSAMPLLRQCRHVYITEVAGSEDPGDAEDAAIYLSRHGVRARVERADPGERTVADTLIAEVARHGADVLIAGGFGHSRFSEALFGGVTLDLLAQAPCPVLTAH